MGYSRPQPRRLASKLRKIRVRLNLTQQQMAEQVRHRRSPVYPGHVSEFLTSPTTTLLSTILWVSH
jgi:hypothetical protein